MRGAFSSSTLGGTASHCLGFTKLQKNARVAGPSDRTHAVIDFLRGSTPVGKPGGHSAALHLKLRSSDSGRSWRGTSKLNYDLTETPGRCTSTIRIKVRWKGRTKLIVGPYYLAHFYCMIEWIFISLATQFSKRLVSNIGGRIDLRWRR